MTDSSAQKYDVGGVLLDRPFRVRKLGHVQLLAANVRETLDFYTDILGFQVTDIVDFAPRIKDEEMRARVELPHIYFMRNASDHHTFVMSSPELMRLIKGTLEEDARIGQIAWQVGSLAEVVSGEEWFRGLGASILRTGRDTPGSNWHTYLLDDMGHANEIFYGIEQIGWDGQSKPTAMHGAGFRELPSLPYIPEYGEISRAKEAGYDMSAGRNSLETAPGSFDVDGILLSRPFKIMGIGPLRLFVPDMEAALRFYRDTMGLRVTEELVWEGHRCIFLRAAGEHHSIALYPAELREVLRVPGQSCFFSLGMRLANYRQLREARTFFEGKGYEVRQLPAELSPGLGHTLFVVDPGGNYLQFYSSIEQVGWDGRPRAAADRLRIDPDNWPGQLDEQTDSYCEAPYSGPWA